MASYAHRPRVSFLTALMSPVFRISLFVALLVAAGCTGEEAVPIDPANPPTTAAELDLTDVTHSLEPTPQMEQLARRQCLADPDADQGYIEAVDPETGDVMSAITVDCDEVRGE